MIRAASVTGPAMPTINIPTQFLGIRNVYLRTYTQTYAPFNIGWQWHPNSLYPMEFCGYIDAAQTPRAIEARLIDLVTAYTTLAVGNKAGLVLNNDEFGPLCYDYIRNQLAGFIVGGIVQTKAPAVCAFNMPFTGNAYILPNFQPVAAPITFSNAANTGLPNPGCGINWYASSGAVYCSSEDNLVISSNLWTRALQFNSTDHIGNAANGLLFPTSGRYGAAIPNYNGADWILAANSLGGVNNYNVIQTNYRTASNYFLASGVVNPASSTINFNTFLQDSANQGFNASVNSWLQTFNTTQTFNGVVMNGWGLEVAPDFSGYTILNFIPTDPVAANWNNDGQAKPIKKDRYGNIWMKKATVDGLLLVAGNAPPGIATLTLGHEIPPTNLPQNPGLYR